jgi:hypothetical protein
MSKKSTIAFIFYCHEVLDIITPTKLYNLKLENENISVSTKIVRKCKMTLRLI